MWASVGLRKRRLGVSCFLGQCVFTVLGLCVLYFLVAVSLGMDEAMRFGGKGRNDTGFTEEPFPDWCPASACEKQPSLCQQQFLFVVSAGGRTGSTTLLNALNAIPNVWLSGENKGLVAHLRGAFTKTVPFSRRKDQWVEGETSVDAFYHSRINRTRVLLLVQDFVKHSNLPPSNQRGRPAVLGFKDIGLNASDLPFLEEAMPCSRFIFNYRRDISRQAESNWHSRNRDSAAILTNKTNELLAMRLKLRSSTLAFALEDFSPASFTTMARWIGANCTFKSIAHHHIGNSTKGQGKGQCLGSSGDTSTWRSENDWLVVEFASSYRHLNLKKSSAYQAALVQYAHCPIP